MQKFSELPYTRPVIAAAVEEYKRYSEAFKAAKTFEEAKKVFLDAEKLDTHLSTIASLCSIRNTMNTTDEFYEAEMAYLNENLPNLIPAEKAMKEDIVNGPFRADFEKEYGAHFIAVLENDLKTQDERIIPELVKESELSVEYSKAAAYRNMGRLDYTPEHVEKFREQIRTVITPAVDRMRKAQAKRLGLDSVKYYDESLTFAGGNADPIGGKDYMVGQATEMYGALSPETKEFFDFMTKYELFDLETRPGKHLGGYCTSLPEYKAPFIFSNFNGTSADVDVLTHEAGHAFQAYLGERLIPIGVLQGSTSEVCEIHSMSMEFFTYPWMDKFFGDRADEYRYAHLCDALAVIPYMACVDEFQHEVYKNPKMTAKERRGVWRSIEKKYMPWRDYDGNAFLENGGFWMQKQHIFLYPFYYIDYALAQICTFFFYDEMKKDRESAWARYLKLCKAGGTLGYFDLLHYVGIPVPFEDGAVEKAVRGVIEEIESAKY